MKDRSSVKVIVSLLMAALVVAFAAVAMAEEAKPAPAPPAAPAAVTPPPAAVPAALPAPAPEAKKEEVKKEEAKKEEKKADEGKIGWFTLVPRYYYAGYGNSKTFGAADVAGAQGGGAAAAAVQASGLAAAGVPSHGAHIFQLNLDMGGDGLAFELGPYLGLHSFSGATSTSFGSYVGLAWRLEFMDGKLYPGFGFGARLGYVSITGTDIGLEMAGRIPISVTYYVLDDLGIVVEFGIGYGGIGYKTTNPDNFAFTTGLYYDVGVGIRWP